MERPGREMILIIVQRHVTSSTSRCRCDTSRLLAVDVTRAAELILQKIARDCTPITCCTKEANWRRLAQTGENKDTNNAFGNMKICGPEHDAGTWNADSLVATHRRPKRWRTNNPALRIFPRSQQGIAGIPAYLFTTPFVRG
eukprot:1161052-Rhodomonas_salina.1